ncbi:MAG: tRNA 2-thiocytidine(32) synthetase TtcA [Myxococcota bacterium]
MALQDRLVSRISRLNRAFSMIEAGDRVMVACSGGKDSWAMLHLLRHYVARLPFSVSLVAMNLDQGHPGFEADVLRQHFEREGFEHALEYADTYSVVLAQTPEGKTYCSRCSRMRRAILHRVAAKLGANKIALGHHRDDLVETLLMNMMYAGRLRTMVPTLAAQGDGAAVIRPLLWCAENDLATYAAAQGVPIVPCNLCGSQPDTRRRRVKALLAELDAEHPQLRENLLAAAGNVEPDHLLDQRLTGGPAVPIGPHALTVLADSVS